jgi:hypothetical protein
MKYLPLAIFTFCFGKILSQSDDRTKYFPKEELPAQTIPSKKNIWVFILAGQSNMAGRGQVEPMDTLPDKRILTINKEGNLIIAKEPLHFYTPSLTGLDCGLSFAQTLLKKIPENISILLIPTAIGGSSISQWLGDSVRWNVNLLSNFKNKVTIGRRHGTVKGILWHQGESDSNEKDIPLYSFRLSQLLSEFRKIVGKKNLHILIGELGSFSTNNENWQKINEQIESYILTDSHSKIIKTSDLKHKGDKIHFDAEGQRVMGQRFAVEYLKLLK